MKWLSWMTWSQLGLAAISLAGLAFDERQLMGVSVWLKPLKFDLSIFLYGITLIWMLRFYPAGFKSAERIARIVAVSMALEIALITTQAARGVTSHYNVSSRLDATIFQLMGALIAVNTCAAIWLAVLFWMKPPPQPPSPGLLWGIRWGLIMLIAGSTEGGVMIAKNAHTIGAPDGGTGLPFVNWSVNHGDLRAAHAIALHAIQALPLAGWLVDRFRLPSPAAILAFAALAYAGVFIWLLRLALAGIPVLRS